MAKLTKKSVEAFRCPEDKQQAFLWDSELRGFAVRVTKAGAKSYIAEGRIKGSGKSRRVTIGAHGKWTCEEARKEARERLREMDQGVDPQETKQREKILGVTLREVMQGYLQDHDLRPSTKADIEKHVTRNLTAWADKPVASITRHKVAERFREMSERGPGQANLAFRYLRALLNYARERYRTSTDEPILPENPVAVLSGMKVWNKEKAREDHIPNQKLGAVWETLLALGDPNMRNTNDRTTTDIVIFLLLTGARWSEAAELTWNRVNLDEGWWHLPNPKNHNSVTLPLSTVALKLLAARQDSGSKFVFPARGNRNRHVTDARGILTKLKAIAEVERLTPHDLRRTFTRTARQCGIEFVNVELLTNHVPKSILGKHYAERSDLRYLKPQVQQVADWITSDYKTS
ncbi:integrase family protein [Halomonas sp. QHL1]|uniref:tyrosine-type recombinase/integrase n=1 Tax=Halomonas sp. QHL1 TaxID=1123773 RepID=UPI0008FD428C|nr:integrase family protein [Halomonas sp. QHL1]OJA05308.1 hypothetical protein QHL1GM_07855 [Halomonas sp. QHL1]